MCSDGVVLILIGVFVTGGRLGRNIQGGVFIRFFSSSGDSGGGGVRILAEPNGIPSVFDCGKASIKPPQEKIA